MSERRDLIGSTIPLLRRDKVSDCKNNFYFAITANISGQGRSSSEWGSVSEFKNNTTSVNETLPNTRMLHFTTFNLQFRDIVPGSAGTMDIYWIGFFNSKKELETFAAAN